MELITGYFSDFSDRQLKQFEQLLPIYSDWNQKINVISRKDIASMYEHHVLHSLAIAACYSFEPGSLVVDIGTGGGFPGVPLSIFFPEVQFHLVDSIGKKLKVVEAVKEELGLDNLSVEHSRIEDLRGKSFDFAVSRAVAPLNDLWRWSRPLLRNKRNNEQLKNGLICLKGGDLHQEISESGVRPHLTSIHDLFPRDFFLEKYMVYVPV